MNTIIEPIINGWGWAAIFFDYNNNTYDDLYVTNGFPNSYAVDPHDSNLFYINVNNTPFEPVHIRRIKTSKK